MSEFNTLRKKAEKMAEEEHQRRIKRATEVARKLLKVMAAEFDTIPLGDIAQDNPEHRELAKKLLTVFLEEDIAYSDFDFSFQIALQAVSFPSNLAQESMKESFQRCLTGLFGKPARDVTTKEIDALLKKAAEVSPEAKAEEKPVVE